VAPGHTLSLPAIHAKVWGKTPSCVSVRGIHID
jgi:hypothetical protein